MALQGLNRRIARSPAQLRPPSGSYGDSGSVCYVVLVACYTGDYPTELVDIEQLMRSTE